MKRMSRVFLLVLAGLLMVSCSPELAGIRNPVELKSDEMAKIRARYLIGLQHQNIGIAESSMMNIVKQKNSCLILLFQMK